MAPHEHDNVNHEPTVNIVGDAVALGPHRRDLLATYQAWINDFTALRTLGAVAPLPMTLEQETVWYDSLMAGQEAGFTIYETGTWQPIGTTALHGIDYRNRTAALGILIGESAYRGKGLGTETVRLMLDYAYTALGLHSVMLTVAEYNHAGRRAYEKAGFREIGRRRECRWLAGKLWDEIYMDCLATEFTSPLLSRIFVPDDERRGTDLGRGG